MSVLRYSLRTYKSVEVVAVDDDDDEDDDAFVLADDDDVPWEEIAASRLWSTLLEGRDTTA